ncbi:MAG: cytochrome P450, partial [FCB group bacterium]|nr:cytochrome P450 [FCB group bacterium]
MAIQTVRPPGPHRSSSLLNAFALRRDIIGFFRGLASQYGDILLVRAGGRNIYFVNNPDLVQEVLVTRHRSFQKHWVLRMAKHILGEGLLTSDGEFHRRQRRLIQPAFHRQRVASYGAVMVEHAARARERWHEGQELDLAHEMMRLTLSIASKTLFDANVEDEADEFGAALTEALNFFDRILSPLAPILNRLPLPSNRRFARAVTRMDETVYRIINERRASGEDRGDVLSMLLAAQDEDDGGVMTDRQVRDEAITLFLAGHETTANALTWTWHLLSQHPDAAVGLHRELAEVLNGRLPTMDDVPRLEYTRKVFTESMRLYPPAYMLGREAIEDVPLGEYVVPAGDMVVMSQFSIHRDPRFFEDPDAFKPSRWTPEMQEGLPRFAYFPFGGGPRICIGEAFAWTDGILVLATLALRWRFQTVPG